MLDDEKLSSQLDLVEPVCKRGISLAHAYHERSIAADYVTAAAVMCFNDREFTQ